MPSLVRPLLVAALTAGCILTAPARAMTADELAATRHSAEQGSASAQMLLGMAYLRGEAAGSPAEGLHWLEQAALQGNAYAARQLGDEYAGGGHATRNPALAADWYARAAGRDDAEAQFRLGRLYLDSGSGITDKAAARRWLAKAAGNGHAGAAYLLASAFTPAAGGEHPLADLWRSLEELSGHSRSANRPLSSTALRKLASDGDAEAQYLLALDYRDGHGGLPRDANAALDWLGKSAAGGYRPAMDTLARLHGAASSDSIARDKPTAAHWQARAAGR